ncbi:MAG TPA: hypothetical protein ENH75_01665 [archaeon]|nr:hypothetical protein [archaeon]
MKILAFSDWRFQDIEQFIDYLERLKEKPDVIVYAGDGLKRFNNVPYMAVPKILRDQYREELIKIQEPFGKFDKKIIEDIIRHNDIEYKMDVNKFEKIASFSHYGLLVVAGNNDPYYRKKAITGEKVVDIHDNSVIIDDYAIIGIEGIEGIEGSSSKIGLLQYTEKEIIDHLNTKVEQVGDRQLIIISHSPPFKILDFSIMYSQDYIGSHALRDFIEKNSDKVRVVISGHSHLQGGKFKKYKNTYVVNCASHDMPGDPGRIAIVDISDDNVDIGWKTLYELSTVHRVGPKTYQKLIEHGILNVKQLAALRPSNKLYQKFSDIHQNTLNLIINYANAIDSEKIIIKKGIKSALNNLEGKNIYFFDAEYNSETTSSGPYGMFVLGWMDSKGNVQQKFLDNTKDEKEMLNEFCQWLEKENPILIAYRSTIADAPHLQNCLTRLKLPFQQIEYYFFDLYQDVLYTQSLQKQKYFLPLGKPCGLKEVSELLGYQKPDLEISDGILAPIKYEEFLNSRNEKLKEKIKTDLLEYNRDDLKRTKFIYDQLKELE